MSPDFRCSVSSLARSEPLTGTASTVRAFLLIEEPGPWGVAAIPDSRLPQQVTAELLETARPLGVRPLLIRRHGRSNRSSIRIFAAYADPNRPWLQTAELDNPEQVLDLDWPGLARGRSAGLTAVNDPLFLTCTHGRHDACCAERGRPVARALAASHPTDSWEVSHIGGDRFAANLLVLPDGLYSGQLRPDSASELATRHRAGHLDLEHLRGRCGYGFPIQAAEIYLRRHLDETRLGGLDLESQTVQGGVTEAVFAYAAERWRVRVRRGQVTSHLLTCGARRSNPTFAHELVHIEHCPSDLEATPQL